MRTRNGKILKVDIIEKCEICLQNEYVNIEVIDGMRFKNIYHQEDIVNHSKNIIDLIEVGDYVNGKLCIDIEEIITDDGRRNLNLVCLGGSILELSHEIYSILTKEQYEQNVFKVVE